MGFAGIAKPKGLRSSHASPGGERRGWRRIVLLVTLFGGGVHAQEDSSRSAFDAMFEQVFNRYHLPGLAVGVIENGEIAYTRTQGEVAAGGDESITRDTLFKIASNSKAMTTALLARLVDAGKLGWDDPVVKYLPDFRMHDPWVTREMQVRDLLIHNSGLGLGAGDLMLWPEPNAFTRGDVIAGLAHLKPTHSFRSHYAYDNTLYIVAGEIAAVAGGGTYEALMQREVFAPLGLSRCQAGGFDRDVVAHVAQPHMRQNDRNVVIRRDARQIPTSTSAAAGGIRCSLDDMLTWARAWLAPTPAQRAWLSDAQRDALWTAHMPLPLSPQMRDWEQSHFLAYGYGWRLSDANGALKVAHTGTLAGMYSALVLLPESRTGFVLLINGDGGVARRVLSQALLEHFTAPARARTRGVTWYADQLENERADAYAVASKQDTSSRQQASPRELKAWLGVYRDPWFGDVALCAEGRQVRLTARKSPRLSGAVMRVGPRLLVDWRDDSVDAEPWLHFVAATPERAAGMRWSQVDPEADFSYDYADLAFLRVGVCE